IATLAARSALASAAGDGCKEPVRLSNCWIAVAESTSGLTFPPARKTPARPDYSYYWKVRKSSRTLHARGKLLLKSLYLRKVSRVANVHILQRRLRRKSILLSGNRSLNGDSRSPGIADCSGARGLRSLRLIF